MYSSSYDWQYGPEYMGPAPSPNNSPFGYPSRPNGGPTGAYFPAAWAGLERPSWSPAYEPLPYLHPGEPQEDMTPPPKDVRIDRTFIHMMQQRNLRRYGKLYSTWSPLHFWRLVFLLFFFFFALFGSMSFTTTRSEAGYHWQQVYQCAGGFFCSPQGVGVRVCPPCLTSGCSTVCACAPPPRPPGLPSPPCEVHRINDT